jgi:hypothetical protein
MFKHQEAAKLKEEFWTTFGRYMSPIPSSEGKRINWINYKTGLKDVYFRMDVIKHSAIISISIEHREADIREIYFQQFEELKTMLHSELGEEWLWQPIAPMAEGKIISRIYYELTGFSVFNKEQWTNLISFFKPRIIALDRFWEDARYSFEVFK